jgi:hypothetical protein
VNASHELDDSRADTVERLARAVESRDANTAEHVDRMSRLAGRLALDLAWSDEDAEMLRLPSVLHDVGKVGIPDAILRKPGALSIAERAIVGHIRRSATPSSPARRADCFASPTTSPGRITSVSTEAAIRAGSSASKSRSRAASRRLPTCSTP